MKSSRQPGLEFVPVEIPGRGSRLSEAPLSDMDTLVSELLDALSPEFADGPFGFLGHSMGAHVAYETTRRLMVSQGPLPRVIVASGARPPCAPDSDKLHDLEDSELLAALDRLGGTPRELLANDELMSLVLPVIRADLTLLSGYLERAPGAVLPCPIVALGADGDRLAGPEWIGGWRAVTTGRFHRRIFAGDHFFLSQHWLEVMDEIAAGVADL